MKKILLILIISIIPLTFFVQSSFAAPPLEREPFEYKLMVPLPTSKGVATSTSGIVDYIMVLYYFLFGLAGVTAMALIIYSGFQWTTAGANYSKTSQAKTRISNAVLGLVILLASYVILQTINPSFTSLKEPYVQFMMWDELFTGEGSAGTNPGPGGTAPDWCATDHVTWCPGYQPGHAGECSSDPCGVGPCVIDAGGVCTACPPPAGACVMMAPDPSQCNCLPSNPCSACCVVSISGDCTLKPGGP